METKGKGGIRIKNSNKQIFFKCNNKKKNRINIEFSMILIISMILI